MDLSTEQYEKIIRFLDADMTPEEMDLFEKELSGNPAMRRQLDFELSIREALFQGAAGVTVAEPAVFPNSNVPMPEVEAPVKTIGMKKWLAIGIAASVLIAVAALALFRPKTSTTPPVVQGKDTINNRPAHTPQVVITSPGDSSRHIDDTRLFKKYFKKDEPPEEYPMFLAEALAGYESGEYAAILQLNLADIPETRGTGNKETILQLGHYYKGLSFLQTGNATQAINNLQWVITNSKDRSLQVKATWYQALALIKNNEPQKAIELLTKLDKDASHLPVKAIINDLKK